MKKYLLLIALGLIAVGVGWPSTSHAWLSRGTNCFNTLPCPHWTGITVSSNVPTATWTLACTPGIPYTCNGITGVGSRDVGSAECTNGSCAAAGSNLDITISGTAPGYSCTGQTRTVQPYTLATFAAPYWADVQMALTCVPVATNTPPGGYIDAADCTSLTGWALDPDYAGSILVQIYVDGPAGVGTLVATVTANQPRPDVGAVYPGHTNSGWTWAIPSLYKNGAPHTFYAYGVNVDSAGTATGNNAALASNPSPLSLTCVQPPTGAFTGATCTQAVGTATDPQGAPVSVQIQANGVSVGSGPANPAFAIPISLAPSTDGLNKAYTLHAYAQDIPSGNFYELLSPQDTTCTPTPPIVSIAANPTSIPYGTASTITWNSTKATYCLASGGSGTWPGTSAYPGGGAANGTANTGPLTADTTYTMTCSNDGGTVPASVLVRVLAAPLATVTLSATSPIITSGTTVVNWSSSNATSCTAANGSAGWVAPRGLTGSWTSGPLASTTTYTMTCVNIAGVPATANTTVVVNAPTPPTTTIQSAVQPDYCTVGTPRATVTWIYNSPSGLPQGKWQMQVATGAGFTGTPYYDSGIQNSGAQVAVTGNLAFNNTNYWIRMQTWDNVGTPSGWSTSYALTTPGNPYPAVSFTLTPEKPIAKEDTVFTDTSVYAPGSSATQRVWDFGDGTPVVTEIPGTGTITHAYNDPSASGITATLTLQATGMDPADTCNASVPISISKALPKYREVRPGGPVTTP